MEDNHLLKQTVDFFATSTDMLVDTLVEYFQKTVSDSLDFDKRRESNDTPFFWKFRLSGLHCCKNQNKTFHNGVTVLRLTQTFFHGRKTLHLVVLKFLRSHFLEKNLLVETFPLFRLKEVSTHGEYLQLVESSGKTKKKRFKRNCNFGPFAPIRCILQGSKPKLRERSNFPQRD